MLQAGLADVANAEQQARAKLTTSGFVVDHVSVRNAHDLSPRSCARGQMIVLATARMGRTRLIDNLCFEVRDSQ